MMRFKRITAAAAAGITLAGVAIIGTGAPATAGPRATPGDRSAARSGNCWKANDGKLRFWCHNVVGMSVHLKGWGEDNDKIVGVIESNPSWFVCRIDGGAIHGGPHPSRWIKTVADDGDEGYVSDNDILDETDPIWTC